MKTIWKFVIAFNVVLYVSVIGLCLYPNQNFICVRTEEERSSGATFLNNLTSEENDNFEFKIFILVLLSCWCLSQFYQAVMKERRNPKKCLLRETLSVNVNVIDVQNRENTFRSKCVSTARNFEIQNRSDVEGFANYRSLINDETARKLWILLKQRKILQSRLRQLNAENSEFVTTNRKRGHWMCIQ